MQSTASRTQATKPPLGTTDVASDLTAFIVYVTKESGRDFFRAVGELELSITQIKALMLLDRADEELTLKTLAGELSVSLPAASRSVEGLHGKGFVERREDHEDRRMKRVRITATGREVIQSLTEARLAGIEQFVSTLSARERRLLSGAVAALLERREISACRPRGVR
ncbi:MAG: MarR family transcriptional regulator [Solirubrobacterales bacterium]|nr:MAG: MarR family transcriptional regulator [Solirubrobacterales bacterium]